jgi:ADP-heptose:LPS heptosyltransferase
MRVLVYRLGSLGDTVVALPCFHLLRQAFPGAGITVLTNEPVSGKAAPLASILEPTGLIDAVIPYPVGLRDPGKLLALIARLRAEKFDLLVDLAAARGLAASGRDWAFFKACGIPRLIGIPWKREDLVYQPGESEAARLLRRIRPLGEVDLHESKWTDLRLSDEEKSEATRLLGAASIGGRFIAASLGTKWPTNDWGLEKWQQVLARLGASRPGLGLVLLGSGDEFERSQALAQAWTGPAANLCGRTSPRVSAAVLAKASLFLGHDSGPMHLAAAAGARCVTIFSARCPAGQWFPAGEGQLNLYPARFYDPARTDDPAHQRQALDSIRVEDVLTASEGAL